MKSMKLALMLLLFMIAKFSFAQKDKIEHIWFNEEKTSKIEIFKGTDGKYYGKIVWLKEPNDNTGKARTDNKNPDGSLQSKPLLNLVMLTGFSQSTDANVYEGGKVYDPNSGKTYCGKLTYEGKTIKLKGFICSLSLLGRTTTWTLAQ